MSFPTLAEVKAYYNIVTNDNDTQLTAILAWTEGLITAYLGRDLNQTTYEKELYKPRTELILLDNYPIDSLTSITLDGEVKVLTDFKVIKKTGHLYGNFVTQTEGTIVYVGGYAVLPPVISDVFYMIINDRYDDFLGTPDANIKDVTLFDFAKVTYEPGSASSAISYSGVGSGEVPGPLQSYLGMLNLYRSDRAVLSADGTG